MPDFSFTGPDGKAYEISGPEGATREQAFQLLPNKYPELKGQPGFGGQSAPALEPGLSGIQEAIGLPKDSPKTRTATDVVKDWFTTGERATLSGGEIGGTMAAETVGGAVAGLALPPLMEKGGAMLRKVPFGPAKAVGGTMEAAGTMLSHLPAGERALQGAGGGAAQSVVDLSTKGFGLAPVVSVPLSLGVGGLGEAGTSFVTKEGGRLTQFALKAAQGDPNAAVGALKGMFNPYKEMNAKSAASLQKALFKDHIPVDINSLISSDNRIAAQEAMRKADPTLVTGMARKPPEPQVQPIPGSATQMSGATDLAEASTMQYGKPGAPMLGNPQKALPGPAGAPTAATPKDTSRMAKVMAQRQAEEAAAKEAAAKAAMRPASEIYRERMTTGITQAIGQGKLFSTSPAAQAFAKKINLLVQARELTSPQAEKLLASLRTDRNPSPAVRERFATNLDNTIRTWGKPAEKGGQEGAAVIPARLAEEIRTDLRTAVNHYTESIGLSKVESQYRKAYETEKLAEAKDKLPHFLYGFGDKAEFDKLARNLAKDPDTKQFLQSSMGNHLASVPPQDVSKEFLRLQKTLVNAELLTPVELKEMRTQAESISRVVDKGIQLRAAQRFQRAVLSTMSRNVMGKAGGMAGDAMQQRQQAQ